MARYVTGLAGATAGTTARPVISLYGIAAVSGELREAAVFNTTTTAARHQLARLTNATGQGAGQTEAKYDDDTDTASCTTFITHTADTGIGDKMHMMPCGAAIGSGTILTFYDRGIEWPVGTANGLGIIVATGTGQIADSHLVWDE